MKVDVYPVGVLADFLGVWRALRTPAGRFPAVIRSRVTWRWRIGRARASLRHARQTVARHVRARDWHNLRQSLNGYLAEPDEFPPGDYVRRCGRGWTKAAALRSLDRRLPAARCRCDPRPPDVIYDPVAGSPDRCGRCRNLP